MKRESVKKRRLLFNCDGCSVWRDAQGDIGAWIENVFTGLVDSQVDALLWCDGAGGNTASYNSQVLELTGARAGQVDPALRRAIAAGNDPPQVIVREARQRGLDVFYSFRINDCHDAFMPEELPTFKIEHPEWQIGQGAAYGPHTALNFAFPEVRALKLRTVEELFAQYDFDGIEIDLLRGPPFFKPFFESRHSYLLTDLLRAMRHSLDQRAQQRGRRIEVAVRVDENLMACHLDGFDVSTWVEEDLLDLLILGSGVLEVEVEEFRALAHGSHVQIFPCLYGWPSGYSPVSPALARGLAATYWRQGADGIYLFNWFPHEAKFRYQVELLKQIGSVGTLAGQEMVFAAERGFAERPDNYYPHNWRRATLPAELWPSAVPLRVRVRAGAELTGKVQLRLEVADLGTRRFGVRVNGQALGALHQEGQDGWRGEVAASDLVAGDNYVEVLLESQAVSGPPPKITAIELHGNSLSGAE